MANALALQPYKKNKKTRRKPRLISHRFYSYCGVLVKFSLSICGHFSTSSFAVSSRISKLTTTRFGVKKLKHGRTLRCKRHFDILICLGVAYQCDRRTDGRTDRQNGGLTSLHAR